MLNQLRFVLKWVHYNYKITMIYIIVLSMIVCSSILLMQFFYGESTYIQDGNYYYCYYLNESIEENVVDEILEDLEKNDIFPLEFEVATLLPQYNTYNQYTVAAYYVLDEVEMEKRNESYSYGKFNNIDLTCIGEMEEEPFIINQQKFKFEGSGNVVIGTSCCDYLITKNDYKKYIDTVDVIEITLKQKNNDLDKIINKYVSNYEEENSTGILDSGFDNVKGTALVSLIYIAVALYATLTFVKVVIDLQKKDIAVFYQCGADIKSIRKLYVVQIVLLGWICFLIGVFLTSMFVHFFEYNFEKINLWVIILSFLVFNFCYFIEAVIYIKIILNKVDIISKDIE